MKLVRCAQIIGLALALVSTASCSRNGIEAINLANEGDQSVKVNVENAIAKYEQAVQLDPTNHRILWNLGLRDESLSRTVRKERGLMRPLRTAG